MDDFNVKDMLYSTWQREEGETFTQMLIDKDLDINSWKNKGKTMLSYAAKWGDLQFVKFLVKNGAGCDVTNCNGSKPLHIAAKGGHKDIVKFFLELEVFVDSCDDDRRTSLHYIARKSKYLKTERKTCVEVVRFLVAKGANIDVVDKNGYTPILLAGKNCNEDIVKLFIELGACVKGCDKCRSYALLHHASKNGWEGIVQFLLKWRSAIDINAKNLKDESPLLLAAFSSHKSIVKLLLESGADIEGQIDKGFTLLHLASLKGWLDVVKYLLERGWDINSRSYFMETPLILATKGAHSEIALHLIESGADVDCCDNNQQCTALHYALEMKLQDVVKSLLKKRCNINAQNIYSNTPLHIAVFNSGPDIVELLLKAGADLTKEDNNNSTALSLIIDQLDLARIFGPLNFIRNHQNIQLFFENGAYFQSIDFDVMNKNRPLKYSLLTNVKLCTQCVINCFNNLDLVRFYEIPMLSKSLPPIEHLQIVYGSDAAQNIKQSVTLKIQENGYCNILDVHPITLNVLCVKSYLDYYNSLPTIIKK